MTPGLFFIPGGVSDTQWSSCASRSVSTCLPLRDTFPGRRRPSAGGERRHGTWQRRRLAAPSSYMHLAEALEIFIGTFRSKSVSGRRRANPLWMQLQLYSRLTLDTFLFIYLFFRLFFIPPCSFCIPALLLLFQLPNCAKITFAPAARPHSNFCMVALQQLHRL